MSFISVLGENGCIINQKNGMECNSPLLTIYESSSIYADHTEVIEASQCNIGSISGSEGQGNSKHNLHQAEGHNHKIPTTPETGTGL